MPDHGDESYFEIILTATDGGGLTATTSVSIEPQTVQVTLQTSPAGLQVVYDGTPYTAPITRNSIVGSNHDINVPPTQGATHSPRGLTAAPPSTTSPSGRRR